MIKAISSVQDQNKFLHSVNDKGIIFHCVNTFEYQTNIIEKQNNKAF